MSSPVFFFFFFFFFFMQPFLLCWFVDMHDVTATRAYFHQVILSHTSSSLDDHNWVETHLLSPFLPPVQTKKRFKGIILKSLKLNFPIMRTMLADQLLFEAVCQ